MHTNPNFQFSPASQYQYFVPLEGRNRRLYKKVDGLFDPLRPKLRLWNRPDKPKQQDELNQSSHDRETLDDEMLKPVGMLAGTMNLKAVKHWIAGYHNFIEHNEN